MALIVTLLVEILGAGEGVGRLLIERQQSFDAPAAWGLLLIVGTFGYLTSATLARVEERLLRNWPERARASEWMVADVSGGAVAPPARAPSRTPR